MAHCQWCLFCGPSLRIHDSLRAKCKTLPDAEENANPGANDVVAQQSTWRIVTGKQKQPLGDYRYFLWWFL